MKQNPSWEGSRYFPLFMEPESSSPCSQQPATGPYPEPDACNPHLHTLYHKHSF